MGFHFINLTHWDRVAHICVDKLTIVCSDNGLSPGWCQAIIWANAGILLIWALGTNFSDILIEIHMSSFQKMPLKMSAKCERLHNLDQVFWCHMASSGNKLTHWGQVTHICISKLTIIGSDNGLSPDRRQAIIWTNAGLLLIGHLGTNFSEILIQILTFSFKKMHLKVSSAKRRPYCLGLNVLSYGPWKGSGICKQNGAR